MNWGAMLAALAILWQAENYAKQHGMSGKVNLVIGFHPADPGIPPVDVPIGSVTV